MQRTRFMYRSCNWTTASAETNYK